MADFFKWADGNPAAGIMLIATLCIFVVAFAASIVLFIWAFVRGRPITMFGFKIPATNLVYETGRIALPANKSRELWDEKYVFNGIRSQVVSKRFTRKFTEKPDVVIGLTKVDGGIGIVRVEAFADSVTSEGFELHFRTSEDSRLYDAAVSWIAIGR